MKNRGRVKKYWLIGLVLSMVWLAGCRQRKPALDFERLAMQMPQQPDSVLQQLQEVTDLSDFSEADRALYYVLLTEAQDKCYVEHTSDSLISWAADYFQRKDDRAHYAKALYLKGRIYEDWQQVDRADSCWFRALEVGRECTDFATMFLLTSSVGLVYAYQRMLDEAFDYCQKSLYYAELSEDSSSISYAHSYVARIYGLREKWPEALAEYEIALNIALKSHQTEAQHTAIQESIGICTRQQLYLKADSLLSLLQNDSSFIPDGSFHLVAGNYYRHKEDTAQAIPYLKKAVRLGNPYTVSNAHLCLSYLYKKWNRPDLAIYYDSLYHACRDSFRLSERPVQVKTAEADYRQEQAETKLKGMKSRFGVVVLAGCVAVSVLMLILYRRRRQREQSEREIHRLNTQMDQEKETFDTVLKNMQTQVCQQADQIQRTQQEIDTLVRQQKLLQKQLHQSLQEQDAKKRLAAAHVLWQQMQKKQAPKALEKEDWELLYFLLDQTDCHFLQRLRIDYPQLNSEDLEYCTLIRLGMEDREEIARYLSVSAEGLRKRKQRLKKRLENEVDLSKRGDLESFIRSYGTSSDPAENGTKSLV